MMGFYKDKKWQPSANEVASGDYPYEKGNSKYSEAGLIRDLNKRIAELEAENQRLRQVIEKQAKVMEGE